MPNDLEIRLKIYKGSIPQVMTPKNTNWTNKFKLTYKSEVEDSKLTTECNWYKTQRKMNYRRAWD